MKNFKWFLKATHLCEECGRRNAEYQPDAYVDELGGETSYIWICNECNNYNAHSA